jgi:hypothetical protein
MKSKLREVDSHALMGKAEKILTMFVKEEKERVSREQK